MKATEQIFSIMRRGGYEPEPEEGLRGYDAYEVRLGDMMRGERATLGKSLLDVQRELRIKAIYIDGIESCDLTVFPTKGFVAGFVRSYARYLGMDPDWVFAKFCEESGFARIHPEAARKRAEAAPARAPAGDPIANPRAPFQPGRQTILSDLTPSGLGSVALLVSLIAVVSYGAWSLVREIQQVTIADAGVETTDLALDPVASAAVPRNTSELATATADAPPIASRETPILSIDPATVGTLAPQAEAPKAETLADAEPVAGSQPVTEDREAGVFVYASRPAWVRIADADGNALFEKILQAEELVPVPEGTGAILRAGNSGAVFVKVDGVLFGPLGEGTNVVKNVDLAPDALRGAFAEVTDEELIRPLRRPKVAEGEGATGQ